MSVSLGVRGFSFPFPCSKVTTYLESWANVFHVDKC